MSKNIQHYQGATLKKPVYLCSQILDPQRKLTAFALTKLSQLHLDPEELFNYFTNQAVFFEKHPDNEVEIVVTRAAPPDEDNFPCHFIKRKTRSWSTTK